MRFLAQLNQHLCIYSDDFRALIILKQVRFKVVRYPFEALPELELYSTWPAHRRLEREEEAEPLAHGAIYRPREQQAADWAAKLTRTQLHDGISIFFFFTSVFLLNRCWRFFGQLNRRIPTRAKIWTRDKRPTLTKKDFRKMRSGPTVSLSLHPTSEPRTATSLQPLIRGKV